MPTSVATAMAARAFRTLYAPTSGTSNSPNGEPPRRTLNRVVAPAEAITRSLVSEVSRDAADEHARIDATVRQQPSGQRRRRRLAMRAGNHDGTRAPEKVFTDRFRQRAVQNLTIQHFFELGISARDRVADDDQIEIAGDVLGIVADQNGDTLGGEEIAHPPI